MPRFLALLAGHVSSFGEFLKLMIGTGIRTADHCFVIIIVFLFLLSGSQPLRVTILTNLLHMMCDMIIIVIIIIIKNINESNI